MKIWEKVLAKPHRLKKEPEFNFNESYWEETQSLQDFKDKYLA